MATATLCFIPPPHGGWDMNRERVMKRLRAACEEAGSPYRWAKDHGILPQYVYMVLAGNRPPGPKLLKAMGIKRKRAESYEDAA